MKPTDDELERVWLEQVTTPVTMNGIRKLMKFYGVSKVLELVDEQSRHIEKLQAKLPPIQDSQPRNYREG